MDKRLTRQQAIAAKCKDCNFDPSDKGNWVQQVESCTDTKCPLWDYRPKSRSKANRAAPQAQNEV